MPNPDTARRGTLSVTSEERGKYTFAIRGDLDGMEWAWILLSALDRVRTTKPQEMEVGRVIEDVVGRRRVG